MSTQATISVRVIGGNVGKALNVLRKEMKKEGLLGYDPNTRGNKEKKPKIKKA